MYCSIYHPPYFLSFPLQLDKTEARPSSKRHLSFRQTEGLTVDACEVPPKDETPIGYIQARLPTSFLGAHWASVPNGLGARQGPTDGLPRPLDRTGRQKICRPRPQNLKTAVFRQDDGPDNLRH